jgi:CRP-like cAMP-binding protein
MPTSPNRRVESSLRRCARGIDKRKPELDALYSERDALYLEGVALGLTQVVLAEWAGSTPAAVAKALRKLRK